VVTSSTVLYSTENPTTVGHSVTLTVEASPAPDGGSMQFMDGISNISSPVPVHRGVATITMSLNTAGAHKLSVVFMPAGVQAIGSSTGTLTETVSPSTPTSTSLAVTQDGIARDDV
jgi:hypothetical protein